MACAAAATTDCSDTLTPPLPCVVERATLLTYPLQPPPFRAFGLELSRASASAPTFCWRAPASKLTRPTGACTTPPLSALNDTRPAEAALTASATVAGDSDDAGTTVPSFGLGIRPLGPSTRAILASFGIIVAAARARSNSTAAEPLSAISEISESPDDGGPRGAGGVGLGRAVLGEEGDPGLLARPGGQRRGAAHGVVAAARVDAEDEGGVDGLVEAGGGFGLESFFFFFFAEHEVEVEVGEAGGIF